MQNKHHFNQDKSNFVKNNPYQAMSVEISNQILKKKLLKSNKQLSVTDQTRAQTELSAIVFLPLF